MCVYKNAMADERYGEGVGFERIRRITGYLTGDTSTWCNAKQSELKDRVKHSIKDGGNHGS